jgi:phosphoglycolate phosphatase-like HAD superfamily hydrolase
MTLRALIFDVDGTLAETEEVHRQAFNTAFATRETGWFWSVTDYRRLLKVTGGDLSPIFPPGLGRVLGLRSGPMRP